MSSTDITVNVVFSAVELGEGMNGFALSQWGRDHDAGVCRATIKVRTPDNQDENVVSVLVS
jgi:hypothetical protein